MERPAQVRTPAPKLPEAVRHRRVNGGLPIHIAAKLLGHLSLQTTQGYVAVYPEQVIRQIQAHVARRRAQRPAEEYREPTDAERADFEQHFRRRKLALGDCYRPYGSECPHEHACLTEMILKVLPAATASTITDSCVRLSCHLQAFGRVARRTRCPISARRLSCCRRDFLHEQQT